MISIANNQVVLTFQAREPKTAIVTHVAFMPSGHREEMRKLATVETVTEVLSIENADQLEVAQVRGWKVVVKKGEVKAGDKCVYFEIDSILPLCDARFAFLASRGTPKTMEDGTEGHRLKTTRLRGVVSQGLVIGIDQFPELADVAAGEDVTEVLGIEKWEPALPVTMGGVARGYYPNHLAPKTDAERIQNLGGEWHILTQSGPWIATEKVDGTSLSVFNSADFGFTVCSRNLSLHDGENVYWTSARAAGLLDLVEPGWGIQGEIVGEGIQGNKLKLKGRKVLVFNVIKDGKYVPRSQWPQWALDRSVPVLDVEFPADPEAAIAQADKLKSTINVDVMAEGIVWHRVNGEGLIELDYRACFKVINNSWLVKYE